VADLIGSGPSVNQVAAIGAAGTGFTASSFALRDGAALTVAGTVDAMIPGGQAFLASTAPGGITIASTGNIEVFGGTASLQSDLFTDQATTGVVTNGGTVELAPATSGGIVTLVSTAGLSTSNLLVGAVSEPNAPTNVPVTQLNIGGPTTTAGGIVIGGSFTFNGALTLDAASSTAPGASGAVTQTAPLTVSILSGTADSFTLTNPGNAITTATNLTAANGDLALLDGANLELTGSIRGRNVFLEVANPGGALTIGAAGFGDEEPPVAIPATLTAASGSRISLVADNITVAAANSTVTAPSGTVELAPFSAINTSLLGNAASGGLVIGQSLLSLITPGISTLVAGCLILLASCW
jgi:hypothetical protein